MVILSIDPGVEKTGYAIFKDGKYVKSGLIKTLKDFPLEKRIEQIYLNLKKIIEDYQPQKIILEQLFFFKNRKTIISVSQSQGTVLLLASQNSIKIEYLTPLQIKQIITGYGQADKKAIEKMLRLSTGISQLKEDDEVDAIACGLAYCYLNEKLVKLKLSKA